MQSEHGFTTIQYVVATALSLVLFVLVANVLVDLYARAAIRDALDEGAHAAISIDAVPSACAARARTVANTLLRGRLGDRVVVRCEVGEEWVVARAEVVLPSWLPWLYPDWRLDLETVVAREG